jgi:hypothetical protein
MELDDRMKSLMS